MPRPKRTTLADVILGMLAAGKKPPTIAAALGCALAYVHVVRSRQRLTEAGKRRVRTTIYQDGWRKRREYRRAETPEEREARLKKIAAKAHATRKHRKAVLEKQRAQALRASQIAARLYAEQKRREWEEDLKVPSSIAARRAHVDRILSAWRQADGQAEARS